MEFPVCEISCLASTLFFQFFVLKFRIHSCCWFPLKSLLLHLQNKKPHAILLILKFVAVVQCSSQLHSCSPSLLTFCSPCDSICFFYFYPPCGGLFLGCVFQSCPQSPVNASAQVLAKQTPDT